MRLVSLVDSGLEVSREDVANLFDPFVHRRVSVDDPEWQIAIRLRKRRIAVKFFRRWLTSHVRNQQRVKQEYTRVWQATSYEHYSLNFPPPRYSPWEWNGQRFLASSFGATRVRQLLLVRILERLGPSKVLEVGCGNGVNLLLLASRFPNIEFTGLELTEEGHASALRLQRLPELPAQMQDYAPLPLRDPSAFRRIRFVRGNAAELPFEDEHFDLLLTVLSLEQMERIRHKALSEISRVTRRNVFMIEPFADMNKGFWQRLNVIRRDYFQGHIDDLPCYGLYPVMATADFPQESFLKVCAVLSEKRSLEVAWI